MPQLYPESVQRLIDEFHRLPGIGARSAERLAFHVLSSPREEAMRLALAVRDVKRSIRACARCFNTAEAELCHICADSAREQGVICVVELPRDIIAIEKCGIFRGLYHVLQGHLDPAAGTGPEKLRGRELCARLRENPQAQEVILALNPTAGGDATAAYIGAQLRADFPQVRVSRLARGLASGTDIESTAPSSLQYALERRQNFAD